MSDGRPPLGPAHAPGTHAPATSAAPDEQRTRPPDAGPGTGDVVLAGRALRKTFTAGDGSELLVLDGVELDVRAGEAVAIVGASGAGKSTLLHLLGGLDRPTAGEVLVEGRPLQALDEREIAAVRNAHIGFVFQFHHLLREFTALENVMIPMRIAGETVRSAARRATVLLTEVGLEQRLQHKPWQLSGGEQQRVAVARALANQPRIILADEPSGNLDTHTSERLHELFFRLRAEHGVALVVATHNRELADRMDRVQLLKEGRLHSLQPV